MLDVNDNAPYIVDGATIRMLKNMSSNYRGEVTVPFTLTVTDPDDWTTGHGPPFRLSVQEGDTNLRIKLTAGNMIINYYHYSCFVVSVITKSI